MNKKLTMWSVAVLLVAVGLSLYLKSSHDNLTPTLTLETIKVGAILSLTSYGAQDSASIKSGLELAREDLAKEGFIIEIEYQDDKTDPKETVNSFSYMNTKEKDFVIGPIWSYLVDAAIPMIEKSQTVTFTPSASSEYIEGSSAYLFQGAPKNILMVPTLVKELDLYGAKNVAVISVNGAWGVSMGEVFDSAIAQSSTNKVLDEVLDFGSEAASMATVVTKVKAARADTILWTGSKDGALALVKKLEEQGMSTPVIGTSGLRDVVTENLIVPKTVPLVAITPEVSSEFVTKYEARYGVKPNSYADNAYDGLMLLVEAKEKTNTKSEMRDYMEKTLRYKGYAGEYSFDENHDQNGGMWVATLMNK